MHWCSEFFMGPERELVVLLEDGLLGEKTFLMARVAR